MSGSIDESNKTKVLFLNTPTLPPIGADTWTLVEIIRALDRSRTEIHVACSAGTKESPTPMFAAIADIPGIIVKPVNLGSELSEHAGWRRISRMLRDFLPALRSFIGLTLYVRRQKIPIIHTVPRPRDALASVLIAKLTRARCLMHMQLAFGSWMSRPLRWSIQNADGFVAISQFVAGTLVQRGQTRAEIFLAYNAVVTQDWSNDNEERAAARDELGLDRAAPVIVTVSRLFREKGTAELLRAMVVVCAEFRDAKLVIVGRDVTGGEFMRELEALIRQHDLHDNVEFVGQRSDVRRFMAAADIFAMPSFEEPFGIVFAEAMAMKLPVVALNNGGTPEVVENGKAGLLSEAGDVAGLADNLLTLLRDPALRSRMGEYGRMQVLERFTAERLANEMSTIYETMAG